MSCWPVQMPNLFTAMARETTLRLTVHQSAVHRHFVFTKNAIYINNIYIYISYIYANVSVVQD